LSHKNIFSIHFLELLFKESFFLSNRYWQRHDFVPGLSDAARAQFFSSFLPTIVTITVCGSTKFGG
jgi:hypothetical protein